MTNRALRFSQCHPGVLFAFFVIAIVFSMILRHPLCIVTNVFSSTALYLLLKGKKALPFLSIMAALIVILSLVNPLLNPQGNTILFTWWGSRPFTLESLSYGITTAFCFVSMMIWFASYNLLLTSEKFTYLFGGLAPALSLLLTMVLRLVPHYQKKTAEIAAARECIGKGLYVDTFSEKVKQGASNLSSLTSWAFDNAACSAESLTSRGYGTGKRSCFGDYSFKTFDYLFLALEFIGTAAVLWLCVSGAAQPDFFPTIAIPPLNGNLLIATGLYTALIGAPFVISLGELILWHSLISKS